MNTLSKRSTSQQGERNHRCKLDEAKVLDIRDRVARGEVKVAVAAIHGIDVSNVTLIAAGRRWGHVGGPLTAARAYVRSSRVAASK